MHLGRTLEQWRAMLGEKNETMRLYAARALGEIGPQALPALLEALEHKDSAVRYWAAVGLGDLGEAAKSAVPKLARALKDDSPSVRTQAAFALWKIERREQALQVLAEQLKHPSRAVRLRAVQTLGSIGPPAKPVLAAVEEATKDKDRYVQNAARQAVKDITGEQ